MLVNEERCSEIDELIVGTYRLFEVGDFFEARRLLDQAHALDFEDLEIRTALRACGFWDRRIRNLESMPDGAPRGDYLRRQWSVFEGRYAANFEHPLDEGRLRIRVWVHNEALASYKKQASETKDSESLFQVGRCFKILGRFEDAIHFFGEALKNAGGADARFMAELADTYALIGEVKPAKVLMREAMFLDVSAIELDELDAPMFRRLVNRLEALIPVESSNFADWLPVYGAFWGVLDIKRELSPVEYGKLKQMIYALKSEIADGDEQGKLTPKLINRYQRLIDHYQSTGADRGTIEEALMNIKLLDPVIYEKYFE